MRALGIEFITVFGLPPVQFVELVADNGCQHISAALQPLDYNPQNYPKYSLKEDRAMRRDLVAVMHDRGVSISLGEGFAVVPGTDMRETWKSDLEAMREMEVKRISSVSMEPDIPRSFDQLAVLAEMAAGYGIETVMEFVPCFEIADLPTAVAAAKHVNRPDFRLVLDTMHMGRTGVKAADIKALDPTIIGYVQLCDAPLKASIPDYMEEAMYDRNVPGEGEMPLQDYLSALPRDVVIGLEVPLRSEAEAGVGADVRVARCVKAARDLFSRIQ